LSRAASTAYQRWRGDPGVDTGIETGTADEFSTFETDKKVDVIRYSGYRTPADKSRNKESVRAMKIAVSGKGGVGKTLLSAFLARAFAAGGSDVIAIDADPDANLGATLGFPDADKIVPISHLKELIRERTGARESSGGLYFTLNPKVDDLPDEYSVRHDRIRLMVMGEVKKGGSGCYCPENALLSSLMSHLLLGRDDVVILDMAAGIEHLSRGTAQAVDKLIIVVEPGRASLETAHRVEQLAADIGIKALAVVGNKVRGANEEAYIRKGIGGLEMLGVIPYDAGLVEAQIRGLPVILNEAIKSSVDAIYAELIVRQQTGK
jgi:CO dehydrogenase maturation factor